MRAFTRLGALVFVSVLSLVTIIHLLPKSRVTEHLQRIALGGSINEVAAYIGWGNEDEEGEGGIRLVVFGDSWVDDTRNEDSEEGKRKGKSWVEILCEEVRRATFLVKKNIYIEKKQILINRLDQLHHASKFCIVSASRCLPCQSGNRSNNLERCLSFHLRTSPGISI